MSSTNCPAAHLFTYAPLSPLHAWFCVCALARLILDTHKTPALSPRPLENCVLQGLLGFGGPRSQYLEVPCLFFHSGLEVSGRKHLYLNGRWAYSDALFGLREETVSSPDRKGQTREDEDRVAKTTQPKTMKSG